MYLNRAVWRFVGAVRGWVAATALAALLASGLSVLVAVVLSRAVREVVSGDGFGGPHLTGLLAWAAGLAVIRALLLWLRDQCAVTTASRVKRSVRRALLAKVFQLGPGESKTASRGGIQTDMVDGVEHLQGYVGFYLPQLVVSWLVPAGTVAVLAFIDPVVAVVVAAGVVLVPLSRRLWRLALRNRAQDHWDRYREYADRLGDSIRGMTSLVALGAVGRRRRRLSRAAEELRVATTANMRASLGVSAVMTAAMAVGTVGATVVAAFDAARGSLDVASVLLVLFLAAEAFRPQQELASYWHEGFYGIAAAEGIAALLATQPSVSETPGVAPVELTGAPSITFEDVGYRYPESEREVVSGVSFTVPGGSTLAVVGRSGAGKTTLSRLLLRDVDPAGGRVLLGGVDVRDYPLIQLRSLTARVAQDVVLLSGTVRENVAAAGSGRPKLASQVVERAIDQAQLRELETVLAGGLDAQVGEGGRLLSGGQRQRVALARALVADARLLVLDEATSALDAENEALLTEVLADHGGSRTTVVIAHRLSTVAHADYVLVLDEGRVAEFGPPDELAQQRGRWADMLAAGRASLRQDALPPGPPLLSGNRVQSSGPLSSSDPVPSRNALALDSSVMTGPPVAPDDHGPASPAAGGGWGNPGEVDEGAHLAGQAAHGLVTLRGLWHALIGWRRLYVASVAFDVIAVLSGIGATVAAAWAVSLAITGHRGADLVVPAIVAGVLVLIRSLASWWENYLSHDLSFRMLARVRLWIYDAIARIAPAGIARRRSGDLLSSSLSDAETLEIFYAHSSIYTLSAWATTPLIWIALLVASPLAAFMVIPVLALCVIITLLVRRRAAPHGQAIRQQIGELSGVIAEDVGAAREIVGYGLQTARTDQMLWLDGDISAEQRRNMRLAGAETAAQGVVAMLAALVAAVAAGWSHAPASTVPVIVILGGASTAALVQWAGMTRHYGGTREAAARIVGLFTARPPVSGHGRAAAYPDRPAPVAAREVSFSWNSVDPLAADRLALDAVSVEVPAGSRVAIAGRSGAGKSTLAALLARFADPSTGEITVARCPLPDFAREQLPRAVSLVPQDTALFAETVRDNLLLATDDPVTDLQLWDVLTLAHADDVVRQLPDGLDTVLAENGHSLSGGERQRLALARAVLHPAAVLLLDESVSHLDVIGERDVQDALAATRRDRTTITIAHRLSTLLAADRILVLDEGELVGDGTHDGLLATCEPYRRLVAPQLAVVR